MEEHVANQFYTVAMTGALVAAIILWILILVFENPLLRFFGVSNLEIFNSAKKYTFWMKISLPVFLFSQVLTCFLRNDGAPLRATAAVIGGGIANIILDISFVFGLKMGISGAGLATMCGQILSVSILLSHYFSKKRGIHFVLPTHFFRKLVLILKTGLPSFVLDIAMGILTILFNNQIVRSNDGELETATLAVYGVVCNVVALVQSLGYAIGQASQPLISQNIGAGKRKRVSQFLKYAVLSSFIIAGIEVLLLELLPIPILKMFIHIEEEAFILTIASSIQRKYYVSFIFLSFNVFCIYYYQSILKANLAFAVSIARGIVLSIFFLFLLPVWFGFEAIWFTMLISEGCIFIFNCITLFYLQRKNKSINE